MITTLISLYAAAALNSNDLPAASTQTVPWNDSAILTASSVPQKNPEYIAPVIKAKSAIAVDLKNGFILYEKNIYDASAIASLTKLMTAVIILEENDLKEVVTVSNHAASTPGSKVWLAPGEKITVENLLNAILINSANDAAVSIAEFNSGNTDSFVQKMNQKSIELGLYSTKFVNPTGLDASAKKNSDESGSKKDKPEKTAPLISLAGINKNESQKELKDNYSTAYDLSLLGRYAFGKSFVRRTVSKKELEVSSTNGSLTHKLKNTNALLDSYLNVIGLKTGTTDEAGECLITVIQDDQGHQILTVILNSPDRYKETKVLADWVFRSYTW